MFFDTNPDFLDSFFQILIYRCVILTFLVTSDKKSYKSNAAQEEEGLNLKNAGKPHFEIYDILSLLRITLTCRLCRQANEVILSSKRL